MPLRLFTALILVFAPPLFAQESESRLKMDELHDDSPGDDVDEIITNAKLRANSGSKSLWSIASVLNYNGGTLNRPLSAERPNISGATGTTDWALMEGQVSGKYTLNSKESLLAGVGVRWIMPLEKSLPARYSGERLDADNPYVMYQRVFRWADFQSVFHVQPMYFTNANLVNLGYVGAVYFEHDNVMDIGDTGLSLGFAIWGEIAVFNKSGSVGDPGTESFVADVREEQSDYQFGIDPTLEYAFSDRFNFRWSVSLANFAHLRSESRGTTFHVDQIVHSMGIGIAVTRDIFLYPNVQFLPEKLSADRTNVALNSNINLF